MLRVLNAVSVSMGLNHKCQIICSAVFFISFLMLPGRPLAETHELNLKIVEPDNRGKSNWRVKISDQAILSGLSEDEPLVLMSIPTKHGSTPLNFIVGEKPHMLAWLHPGPGDSPRFPVVIKTDTSSPRRYEILDKNLSKILSKNVPKAVHYQKDQDTEKLTTTLHLINASEAKKLKPDSSEWQDETDADRLIPDVNYKFLASDFAEKQQNIALRLMPGARRQRKEEHTPLDIHVRTNVAIHTRMGTGIYEDQRRKEITVVIVEIRQEKDIGGEQSNIFEHTWVTLRQTGDTFEIVDRHDDFQRIVPDYTISGNKIDLTINTNLVDSGPTDTPDGSQLLQPQSKRPRLTLSNDSPAVSPLPSGSEMPDNFPPLTLHRGRKP